MKKHLIVLGLLLLPVALFAQGRVGFANTAQTLMTTNSGPIPPPGQLPNANGPTTGVNTYMVGLYIAPQGTADPNAFTLAGTATNLTIPQNGRFAGGNPFVLSGIPGGTTIAFQVRAWTFSAGATYETARNVINAYLGQTTIGQVTPTEGVALVPQLFGTSAGQVGGFVLAPNVIPEPSSIALGLLGLGAIALFRRRK